MDKQKEVYKKRKEFDGTYGTTTKKSEKKSLGGTKEKSVYRKVDDTVVEKVVVAKEKIVVEREVIKKWDRKDDNEQNNINIPITLALN